MFALDSDVAGQSSQPFRSEAAPHHQSHECRDHTNDHDEFSNLTHCSEVARSERRHKLDGKCPYSSEIIMRHSVFRRPPPRTKSAAHFASWHGNIIPTWPRIKRRPKKNLRKSTKPMKCWAIRRNGRNTINWARIGIGPAGSSRRPGGRGERSNRAADFINGAAMAAEFNSNSTERGLATSSKHFSAAAVAGLLSADSAVARQQQSVAQTSKPTSW